MPGNVTKELGAKVACPVCKKAAVIREPGKYRCSGCGEKFSAALDAAGTLRVTLVAAATPPLDLEPPRPAARPSAVCARHPRVPAYESCVRCGDFTCPVCIQRVGRGVHCPDCAARGPAPAGDSLPAVGPGFGDIVQATFTGFAGALGRGSLLALPPMLVFGAAGIVFVGLASGGSLGLAIFAALVLGLVGAALQLVAQVGTFRVLRAALGGGAMPSLADSFAVGSKSVLRLAWTQFLIFALFAGGFALLSLGTAVLGRAMSPIVFLCGVGLVVIIAVIAAIRLSLVVPIVIHEERSGLDAMGRSFAMFGSRPWTIFGVSIVMGVVLVAGGMLVGLLAAALGPLGVVVNLASNVAASVFGQSVLASLYWGIRAGEGARS